ncbi:MAG TPA: 4'-phosphopantetheinyl transferase superfamily protein [Draconibacterium sp.]|nr:4'-phosphopantetheinyl transferase superfamily protein [Draconibacterium sp.]
MPFSKKIEVENGILGIWELTESVDSLINVFQFSWNEKVEFEKFRFEKRKREYLATRLLLQQILNTKAEITYQQSGRPQIKNSKQNISISHSADFVVVFISNDLIGVDVENVNRNIKKVTGRFLHKKEMEWIEKSENRQFLRILFWCAKEAVFKCSCQSGIQFDTQIFIPPFEFEKTDRFKAELTTDSKENYNLNYFYFQNNIVVYCVEVQNNLHERNK